jgi:hypothetical protein
MFLISIYYMPKFYIKYPSSCKIFQDWFDLCKRLYSRCLKNKFCWRGYRVFWGNNKKFSRHDEAFYRETQHQRRLKIKLKKQSACPYHDFAFSWKPWFFMLLQSKFTFTKHQITKEDNKLFDINLDKMWRIVYMTYILFRLMI